MEEKNYSIPEGFTWSFTSLVAYEQCPKSFMLKKLRKVGEEAENFYSQYGSWGHAILESYYKGLIPHIALAEVYEKGFDDAVTLRPPYPKGVVEKSRAAGLRYFQNFKELEPEWEVLDVEKKFEIQIGGYPVVGIVDLVLRHKDTGDIVVVDHKSKSKASMTKEYETYKKQLYIYAKYIKETYGKFPSVMRFNMFKEGYEIDEPFNQEDYDKTMSWVIHVIEQTILDDEWEARPDDFFCFVLCGVKDYCWDKDLYKGKVLAEKEAKLLEGE